MELADEIVELLSSNSGALTDALIKTKVLLHKIGHKELVVWVNKELNGYNDNDELPDYRLINAQVKVSAANLGYEVASHPVPLGHLDEKLRDKLENIKLAHSLAVIEKLLASGESQVLEMPIPMEVNSVLSRGLSNGYMVQRAWSEIPVAAVLNILMQVRSRLLDFILELSSEFSEVESDIEIRKMAGKFDASNLFNSAIFGDNTTILLGTNNTQTVSNHVGKNDFESLAKSLKNNGVSEDDISLLKEAIHNDSNISVVQKDKFGPSVKYWTLSMLSKAMDTVWQVEIGVAGSLLATALNSYYGLIT